MPGSMQGDPNDHRGNYMIRCFLKHRIRVRSLVEAYCLSLDGSSKDGVEVDIFNKHGRAVASNDVDEKYDAFRIYRDLPGQAPGVDTHERCLDLLTEEVCYRRNYHKRAQETRTDAAPDVSSTHPSNPSLGEDLNEALKSLLPHALRIAALVLRTPSLRGNHFEPEDLVDEFCLGVLAGGLLLDEIRQPCVTTEQEYKRNKLIFRERPSG